MIMTVIVASNTGSMAASSDESHGMLWVWLMIPEPLLQQHPLLCIGFIQSFSRICHIIKFNRNERKNKLGMLRKSGLEIWDGVRYAVGIQFETTQIDIQSTKGSEWIMIIKYEPGG